MQLLMIIFSPSDLRSYKTKPALKKRESRIAVEPIPERGWHRVEPVRGLVRWRDLEAFQ